jgi:hypothetical protein
MFGEAGSSCATFTGRLRDSTWHVRCQYVLPPSSQGAANFSSFFGVVWKMERNCITLDMDEGFKYGSMT